MMIGSGGTVTSNISKKYTCSLEVVNIARIDFFWGGVILQSAFFDGVDVYVIQRYWKLHLCVAEMYRTYFVRYWKVLTSYIPIALCIGTWNRRTFSSRPTVVPSLPTLGWHESMASPWHLLPLSVYRQFAFSVVITVFALSQFIENYFAVVREPIAIVVSSALLICFCWSDAPGVASCVYFRWQLEERDN